MNKLFLLLWVAVLAISLTLSSTDATNSPRRPKALNVKEPVDAIVSSWQAFVSAFDLMKIITLIVEIVTSCLLPLVPADSSTGASFHQLVNGVSSTILSPKQHLQLKTQLSEKLSEAPVADIFQKLINIDALNCSSPEYKIIHDFVWKEDDQFADLIKFLYKFGYPNIYVTIEEAYKSAGCSNELIADLPKPPQQNTYGEKKIRYNSTNLPNIRGQYLKSLNSMQDPEPQCNILDIIMKAKETGLIELVQLITTVSREFGTNPSLHFFIGKIQEPIKGKSVRKFRLLQPVKDIIAAIHEQLKQDPVWQTIFDLIASLVGVDFNRLNPVDLLLSIFEFILWGTPFP